MYALIIPMAVMPATLMAFGQLSSENEEIADWLLRLTTAHKRWGFGLCFLYLRNVKGFPWNHKRVYRIYCELELNLRIKPKKRIVREKPGPLGFIARLAGKQAGRRKVGRRGRLREAFGAVMPI